MRAVLTVPDSQGGLVKVFAGEEQRLLNDRASYTVAKDGSDLVIEVDAKDATALRAVLNSVCKVIAVYEKAVEAVKDD